MDGIETIGMPDKPKRTGAERIWQRKDITPGVSRDEGPKFRGVYPGFSAPTLVGREEEGGVGSGGARPLETPSYA